MIESLLSYHYISCPYHTINDCVVIIKKPLPTLAGYPDQWPSGDLYCIL